MPMQEVHRDPYPERHITALDGLRGVAVLMVVLYHSFGTGLPPGRGDPIRETALYAVCRWGFAGVDLFFVLSGFLITGILLKTRAALNFYRVFYLRRALRIFPLYYLAVCIVFFLLPAAQRLSPTVGLNTSPTPLHEQLWFWLNLSNFRTAFNPMIVPGLAHFWSLSIEEQFYFVWPAIIRKVSNRGLGYLCVAGFLLPLALRISNVIPTFGAPDFTYRVTLFHMEGLCAGAGLALLSAGGKLHRCRALFLAALAASASGLTSSLLWPGSAVLQHSIVTLLAAGFFGLVGLCLLGHSRSFGLSKLFSVRRLRAVGDYSYFIYVFHLLVFAEATSFFMTFAVGRWHLVYRGAYRFLIFFSASLLLYGLAALSKRYFETPILNLKRHFPYARDGQVVMPGLGGDFPTPTAPDRDPLQAAKGIPDTPAPDAQTVLGPDIAKTR